MFAFMPSVDFKILVYLLSFNFHMLCMKIFIRVDYFYDRVLPLDYKTNFIFSLRNISIYGKAILIQFVFKCVYLQ